MKTLSRILYTSTLLLTSILGAFAQPNSSGVFEEVTDTPVNTGIVLMAAAGIGYGLKQLRKQKK